MTDKRIKMDCPFCGTPKEEISLSQYGIAWRIRCTNPRCHVEMYDSSKQRVIDKWNCQI